MTVSDAEMSLRALLDRLHEPADPEGRDDRLRIEVAGPADPKSVDRARITGVTLDSRAVVPGSLFCCVVGERHDAHDFAAAAVESGASALLVERRLPLDVPQLLVPDVRAAIGPVSSAFSGRPSRSLRVVGITGTNGKTTTAQFLAAILEHAGWATDVYGTLTGRFTTPEAPVLQAQLAASVAAGKRAVVMEVSSHALALHRVDGTHFEVAVFTNLGQDHLDFHGTEERYFAAKARLFTPELSERGVVNLDDVHGRLLADVGSIPTVGYSAAALEGCGSDAAAHWYRWEGRDVRVPLGGEFNVQNSLAAAVAALELGVSVDDIVGGLATVEPVRGRFERVDAGQPFDVVVDFAHTPDGLRLLLEAARRVVGDGRVIVAFGCGGDRDRTKRPLMGAIAAELADHVVVTSDNPRSEDPEAIIASIIEGVPAEYRRVVTSNPDRRAGIAAALAVARPGDLVVVAGKGHETTQTTGATTVPFDDRDVVRELLENAT
ncbi:MAG: UDP-N-acetylmuramoyl-L-alanyl-D-glutamate--2,6-diaminopimelate ligase [Ilumatobacteraceae bacterium]